MNPDNTIYELTQKALAHAKKHMGVSGLNCVCEIDPTALQQAQQLDERAANDPALLGLPILVKDNIDVRGLHTTAGSLDGYDAVIMTGPTNIMHFCGFPSVAVAGRKADHYGVARGVIMYGTDEHRLYGAALGIEALLARPHGSI